jgi:uncharacterized protein (DUF2225 family)
VYDKEQIDQFKEDWIYSAIIKDEKEQGIYDEWCRIVDECAFDYEWYLRPDGELHIEARSSALFRKTTDQVELLSEAEEE